MDKNNDENIEDITRYLDEFGLQLVTTLDLRSSSRENEAAAERSSADNAPRELPDPDDDEPESSGITLDEPRSTNEGESTVELSDPNEPTVDLSDDSSVALRPNRKRKRSLQLPPLDDEWTEDSSSSATISVEACSFEVAPKRRKTYKKKKPKTSFFEKGDWKVIDDKVYSKGKLVETITWGPDDETVSLVSSDGMKRSFSPRLLDMSLKDVYFALKLLLPKNSPLKIVISKVSRLTKRKPYDVKHIIKKRRAAMEAEL